MHDNDEYIYEIEDELGTDAYYVFDEGRRHFFGGELLIAFILAVVCAYLAKLTGLDDLAIEHRNRLKNWVQHIRGNDKNVKPVPEDNLTESANQLLEQASNQATIDEKAAREELKSLLTDLGMPAVQVDKHADKISEILLARIGRST